MTVELKSARSRDSFRHSFNPTIQHIYIEKQQKSSKVECKNAFCVNSPYDCVFVYVCLRVSNSEEKHADQMQQLCDRMVSHMPGCQMTFSPCQPGFQTLSTVSDTLSESTGPPLMQADIIVEPKIEEKRACRTMKWLSRHKKPQ